MVECGKPYRIHCTNNMGALQMEGYMAVWSFRKDVALQLVFARWEQGVQE